LGGGDGGGGASLSGIKRYWSHKKKGKRTMGRLKVLEKRTNGEGPKRNRRHTKGPIPPKGVVHACKEKKNVGGRTGTRTGENEEAPGHDFWGGRIFWRKKKGGQKKVETN